MNEEPNTIRIEKRGDAYALIVDGIHRGFVDGGQVEKVMEVRQRWEPMERADIRPGFIRNPDLEEANQRAGVSPADEIWINDLYQAVLRRMVRNGETDPPPNNSGMLHISIHRHDRWPIGDWRHMQQIKNELAGPERTAVEIYPPESELVDSSNEYHLWVLDEGVDLPFAFHEGLVTSDEQLEKFNAARGGKYKGRQRPWQKGLTTGRGPEAKVIDAETETILDQITGQGDGR